MPHIFASLLVHVFFSPKGRVPDLSPDLSGRLFPYLGGIVRELSGVARIVNGPADHVHFFRASTPSERPNWTSQGRLGVAGFTGSTRTPET